MRSTPEPEMVIALAERVRNTRALLAALEAQWEALFASPATEDNDGGERSSLPDRIIELVEGDPDRDFKSEEVATALGAKQSSVASVLSRLVRERRIEKRGFSAYGARVITPEEAFGLPERALSLALEEQKAEEATEVAP